MNIMLLGAPGAGKGTQAEILQRQLKISIIGTGNIIREAIAKGSELGKKFQSYTEKGDLVPDDLVVEMVADRLKQPDCKAGYILDGFPRTIVQAERFEAMGCKLDAVINLVVSDQEIIERMVGRRVCEKCGASYHLVNIPPKQEGICDRCGAALVSRSDDAPETVRKRLEVYHEQTEPLVAFYRSRGILHDIDTTLGLQKVTETITRILGVG